MNNDFGLSVETIAKIRSVFAAHPEIEQARIYGSRAKGNYRTGSDIDVCLSGNSELIHANFHTLLNELDDAMLPYTMDISIYDYFENPALTEHIDRVGQLFYSKSGIE